MRYRSIVSIGVLVAATIGSPDVAVAQCHQRVIAPDGFINDRFGSSVAISGNVLVVGAASQGNPNGDPALGRGAAYLYLRSGTQWNYLQKLLPSNSAIGQEYGFSVAISGDYVAVGAPSDATFTSTGGAVFVFKRSGNVWTQTAKLIGLDTSANDYFGKAVAIDGDRIVVGAPLSEQTGAKAESGAAYLFKRVANTENWVQEQILLASDLQSGDWMG